MPSSPSKPDRAGWLRGVTYAHRGLHGHGRVENSTGAFAAAIAAGLGIECDVQLTADHRAVVFHDWELDRLTGETGAVGARNVDALTNIALRGSGEQIPTLRDLLDQVGGQVPLLIEIKSRAERSPSALCRAVARDLEGYCGPSAVMSFDPRVGQWFAGHAAHVVRGLVVTEAGARTFMAAMKRRSWLRRSRADFLAYDVRDLPSAFAASRRAQGSPVLTWTVSTPALLKTGHEHADGWIAEGEGLT